ncbi:hypothetical protein, partial [Marinococcus halophilus]|uniref:hypothetical protein n=1 Tax=Marinococcus halophilus TaxID=1371 RepID=UPI001E2CEB08
PFQPKDFPFHFCWIPSFTFSHKKNTSICRSYYEYDVRGAFICLIYLGHFIVNTTYDVGGVFSCLILWGHSIQVE